MRSFVLPMTLGLALLPGAALTQSFEAGLSLPAPVHPNAVSVTDMNGDGWVDLVAPSWSPNRLAIYLGDGAGGFAAAVTYPTGTGPRFAATADFNGDGHPDVATANSDSADVSIFLGTGTGTVEVRPRIAAGATAFHVSVGDVNADGKLDLAVANAGAGTVSLFLGDGTGAFGSAVTISAGSSPHSSAMADFDRDGNTDLAVANHGSSDVWLFRGDGLGGMGTPSVFPVGTSPFTLAAADLDSDGWIDLAVPNFGSNSVSVLRNDGLGGFVISTIPVGRSPRAVVGADLDGDGDTDLAVAHRDGNTVGVWLGDGAGAFAPGGSFGTGSGPFHLAAADVDRDGVLDLVTADRDSHALTVMRGAPGGRLLAPTAYATGSGPRGLAAADLDGDGQLDLVTADTAADRVTVLKGTGQGSVGPGASLPVGRSPYAVVVGDFNGDGAPDIASANSGANRVSVLRGNGSGGFVAALHSTAGPGPRALAAGDFNLDGRLDLATANFTANAVGLLLGTGTGSFAAPVVLPTGTGPSGIVSVDLDGDGWLDLATANATTNNVSILLATGPATFATASSFAVGVKPSALAAGDVDGDGHPDLAIANEASNTVSILLGNGAGGFVAAGLLSVCTRPLGLTLAEFTGDTHLDVAVACATTNNVSVAAGAGDGSFGPALSLPGGVFARAVAAGDFNGDGQPDLAIANQNSNDVWLVSNRSGAVADLALSLSNGATFVLGGAPVSYALVVTNVGPDAVASVSLELGLPAELQDPVYTPSAGSFDDSTGEWAGVDLDPGDQVTLTVSGVVSAAASSSLTVSASVSHVAGAVDPVGPNNSASDVDPVVRGHADLGVSLSDGLTELAAGDPVTYTILVANAGPIDVEAATLSATLPDTLLDVTWTCVAAGGATCTPAGSGAIADAVDLPSSASATYVLRAQVDPSAATGVLTVTSAVEVPPDVIDPDAANNAASDSDALHGDVAPVAHPQSVTVEEDGAVAITLTASDEEGDPLTFSVLSDPEHGALTGVPPNLAYTPQADYFGTDSFTFSAHDGILSASATISITVTPVNDPPQAIGQSIATDEDVSVGVILDAVDVDGDPLTYAIVTPPSLGTLTGSGAARTYVPQANASGGDGFTFVVSDGQIESAAATVNVVVSPVNDVPAVTSPIPDLIVAGEDTSASVDLAGTFDDVESGEAGLAISATSSNPALVVPSITGGTLTLHLTADQGGSAVVTVRATDPDAAFVEDAFLVTVVRPGARLGVSDASRGEGSSSGVVFTISLSAPATQTVTVGYQTVDGTAAAPADYGSLSGTATFAPGVTSRTVKVATVGDVIDEADETFALVLGSPTGATIEDGVGIGTIVDNDTAGLSVQDISAAEGQAGVSPASFNVSLSIPSSQDVSVSFTTVPVSGSATAGTDYLARSGSLTFPAGSTAPQTVTVDVVGDAIDETNEAFSLQLHDAVNATVTRALARATIVDDDDPPAVGITDVSLAEGSSGNTVFVFSLTLSAPSAFTTRVKYDTADGTAIAGADYTARSGDVVFAPGVTAMAVAITVLGDSALEPDETFVVNLHSPVNLTIGDGQGLGTILNDE